MTCGNGDSISYSYDSFDRLIKTRYNDTGDELLYTYNAEGSMAQLELRRNSTTVGIFSYAYDSLGRLIRSRQTDGTNTIQRTEHLYDAANRLKQQNYTVGNKSFTTNYTYSSTDGLLTYMDYATTASNETQIRYAYDANGIRSSKKVNHTVHSYVTQSGKVVRETIGSGSTAKILDFIYDESGRPFALNYSTNNGSTFTTYYYILNLQGDVIKLVNASGTASATYSYDAWGNIRSSSGTLAAVNPLRYRGYYYDTETGVYYLQSRFCRNSAESWSKYSCRKKLFWGAQALSTTQNRLEGK